MQQNRVYKYRCYAPRDPVEAALAEQLFGQAWNYREQLRRIYNDHKREVRSLLAGADAFNHVRAFAHVELNARIRAARKLSRRAPSLVPR